MENIPSENKLTYCKEDLNDDFNHSKQTLNLELIFKSILLKNKIYKWNEKSNIFELDCNCPICLANLQEIANETAKENTNNQNHNNTENINFNNDKKNYFFEDKQLNSNFDSHILENNKDEIINNEIPNNIYLSKIHDDNYNEICKDSQLNKFENINEIDNFDKDNNIEVDVLIDKEEIKVKEQVICGSNTLKNNNYNDGAIFILTPCFHFICGSCFEQLKISYSNCHLCRKEIENYFTFNLSKFLAIIKEKLKLKNNSLSEVIINNNNIDGNDKNLNSNNTLKQQNAFTQSSINIENNDIKLTEITKDENTVNNIHTTPHNSEINITNMSSIIDQNIVDELLLNFQSIVPFQYPKPIIVDNEEEFNLFTKDEFTRELNFIDNSLQNINKDLFGNWNSSFKQHELSFYTETLELFTQTTEMNILNTPKNHFDKNKEIIENIQKLIKRIEKLKKREFTIQEKSGILQRDEELFSISIPTTFEKARKKKKR